MAHHDNNAVVGLSGIEVGLGQVLRSQPDCG
jgi:hypothetical protein